MDNRGQAGFSPWQQRLFGICFGVFMLFCLEGAARVFYTPSLLDNIMVVLKQDERLLWRQKPGLDTVFERARICTDKNGFRIGAAGQKTPAKNTPGQSAGKLIVCMGASPDFGWGVEFENIYSTLLEGKLKNAGHPDVRVLNVAGIGYSSWQGKRLLEDKILDLKPDIVTIPFVINDIDKYRFFRSEPVPDKNLKPLPGWLVWSKNMADKSMFFHMFSRLLFRLRWSKGGVWKNSAPGDGKKPVSGQVFFRPGPNRVGIEDYRQNLEDMLAVCRKNGIKPVLIKFPVNLPAPETVSWQARQKAAGFLGQALDAFGAKKLNEAAALLRRLVELDPYCSNAWYWLGVCEQKQGNGQKAAHCFEKARTSEVFKCGLDAKAYNSVMQDVAVKNNVVLCDLVKAFAPFDPDELFLTSHSDPIHPGAKGHSVAAQNLFDVLTDRKSFSL